MRCGYALVNINNSCIHFAHGSYTDAIDWSVFLFSEEFFESVESRDDGDSPLSCPLSSSLRGRVCESRHFRRSVSATTVHAQVCMCVLQFGRNEMHDHKSAFMSHRV